MPPKLQCSRQCKGCGIVTLLFSGSSHEFLGLLILILPFTQTVHQKAIVVSIVQNHIVMLHVPLQFESLRFVLPTNYQVSGFLFQVVYYNYWRVCLDFVENIIIRSFSYKYGCRYFGLGRTGGKFFGGQFFLPWRRTMQRCHVAQHGMPLGVGGWEAGEVKPAIRDRV